jgi:hypothetical protein
MDIPEENLSKQMMARFRRELGPKPSLSHINNILRIASNVRQAADIARPVPKEVLNQADQGVNHVQSALSMHENNANLSEVLHHLKPGVDAITGAGHAIFNLGKEVHGKLESASEASPGIYSDVLDTTLGVPHEHLDNFVQEANKGN